jgi:hypothetical protein
LTSEEILTEYTFQPRLKWPLDVFIEGGKGSRKVETVLGLAKADPVRKEGKY